MGSEAKFVELVKMPAAVKHIARGIVHRSGRPHGSTHPVIMLEDEYHFSPWLKVTLCRQNALLAKGTFLACALCSISNLWRRPPELFETWCCIGPFPRPSRGWGGAAVCDR